MLNDGRGFLITDDLTPFADCERLLEDGFPFDRLLEPMARLAGKLHGAKLHHRDLYIGHFWANIDEDPIALRLIDAARVKPLPRWFARRWRVKDVAQFVFSLQRFDVDTPTVSRWLDIYGKSGGEAPTPMFRRAVDSKVAWIARHDAKLRRKNPTRNVPIDR
jgi:hypothetical protein